MVEDHGGLGTGTTPAEMVGTKTSVITGEEQLQSSPRFVIPWEDLQTTLRPSGDKRALLDRIKVEDILRGLLKTLASPLR